MRDIVLFRHSLFKLSEPFIAAQARALRRYRPLYLGLQRKGPAPPGSEVLALRDRFGWPGVGWEVLSRAPGPYQALLGARAPALIQAHFGVDGSYALPLARRLDVPLVTMFHGFDATLSLPGLMADPTYIQYALHRRALARAGDLFLCASDFLRARLLALGFPEARTHVHYIGVDTGAIVPRDPSGERRLVLQVARLVPVKGTEVLIRAFARLPPRHRDVTLAIIGDGPLRPRLERLAARLGVAVEFRGARPHGETLAAMRQAALVVMSSVRAPDGREEGLGLAMLEAAAGGVPVIGSRSGGIPEGVIDGETGLLVPPGDAAALAAAIAALLDDEPLRRRMGAAGRGLAEARFDLSRQTERLEAHYDALL